MTPDGTTSPTQPSPRRGPRRRGRRGRRGSVYILVLGLTAMSVVIGAGAIAVSRLGTRSAVDSRDWNEASVLAASAVDAAIARINADATWRVQLVSGVTSTPVSLGRGRMAYRVVDESDNDLSLGLLGPVRVYGIGAVGRARRCLSAVIAPEGESGPAVEALRSTVYSASTIDFSGTTTFAGAPAGSGVSANVALLSTVKGRIESLLVVPLGSITGGFTLLDFPRQMPSAGAYDFYAASATPIDFGATGGNIERTLLSDAANPWGATNPDGIYSITVPGGGRLRIRECRLSATLVVTLGAGATLEVRDSVNWAPASTRAPMLIVRSSGSASVQLRNGTANLSESTYGVNFNPPHTPYNGVSDNSLSTSYPAELRGVIHIIGGGVSTSITDGTRIVGALASEGSIAASGNATVTYDATLLTNAPEGYSTSVGRMGAVRGTWRWEGSVP